MSNLQGKGLGTKKFALKLWRERGKNNGNLKGGREGGRGFSFSHMPVSQNHPSYLFIYLEEKFSSLSLPKIAFAM